VPKTLRQHYRLCNGVIAEKYRRSPFSTDSGSKTTARTRRHCWRLYATVPDPSAPLSSLCRRYGLCYTEPRVITPLWSLGHRYKHFANVRSQ